MSVKNNIEKFNMNMNMNMKMLKAAVAGLVLFVSGFANAGLIVDPVANGSGCCGSGERGYYFETPEDFQLNSLWLNTSSGLSTSYNIEILLFDAIPSGSNYSTVAAYTNVNGILDVEFDFGAGDIFGLIAWDNNLSETPYSTDVTKSIFTSPIQLNRMYKQSLGQGGNIYVESGSNIGAIGFSYSSISVPEPSTLAIFALGIMGLASRRFKKQ
jgi:hypothetical protein